MWGRKQENRCEMGEGVRRPDPAATHFWIFRITHGPRSIADGPSLRFLSAEITLKLLNGGVRHLSKKRDATGQICCRGNKMELLEVLIHSMRGGSRAAEQLLCPRASARREDS